ncbi:hypothetical protein GYB57_04345 [bacterium]|nr:hypothetical protein [bacterium]
MEYHRRRFEHGAPKWFYAACLLGYNFKNFKRFLIYIFHFSGYIDLRVKSSDQYSNEEIAKLLELRFPIKIERLFLYQLTGLSKNTFKKHFGIYLQENDLVQKRKFTLLETYHLLNFWQGEGEWVRINAINKKTLADVLSSGDYKKLQEEFDLYIGNENYKRIDKFPPKVIRGFLEHIDILDSEVVEKILGVEEQVKVYQTLSEFLIFKDKIYNLPTNLNGHFVSIVQIQ